MSWLERRRPKKSHPWPPHDRRVLPQLYRGSMLKAVFALAMPYVLPRRDRERERFANGGGYYVPFPQTAEEFRAADLCYAGEGR